LLDNFCNFLRFSKKQRTFCPPKKIVLVGRLGVIVGAKGSEKLSM